MPPPPEPPPPPPAPAIDVKAAPTVVQTKSKRIRTRKATRGPSGLSIPRSMTGISPASMSPSGINLNIPKNP